MDIMQGWQGRCLEDFHAGDVIQHRLGRTVSSTDNTWFSLLTVNTNPNHFDHHFMKNSEFGKPLVNATLTFAIVTGLSVIDISQNALALGWESVRLFRPVFEDDTLYAQSEILSTRPSKSRPNAGIVTLRTTGYNQNGSPVIEFERAILVYKRESLPPTQELIRESTQNPHQEDQS